MLALNLTLLIQMALFLVFAGIMNAIFFKPVTKALADRKAYIQQQHAQATSDLQAIAALQTDYEARLKAARQEAQEAIAQAVGQAESHRHELLASVKTEVAGQVASARESIRSERDQALAELSGDVSQLASLIARKVAGESSVAAVGGGAE
jgi:F-type H+-transporting ATPase subunit b